MAHEIVDKERKKMEERIFQQQEVELLRRRLEDIESELHFAASVDTEDSRFMKRLMEACSEDLDMVKSMDLSKSIDMETSLVQRPNIQGLDTNSGYTYGNRNMDFPNKACLTTVYEDEEEYNQEDVEQKEEVIEEKMMIFTTDDSKENLEKSNSLQDIAEFGEYRMCDEPNIPKDATSSRQKRIQNIFTLCGNYRELSHHNSTSMPTKMTQTDESATRIVDQLQKSIFNDTLVSDNLENEQKLGESELGKISSFNEIAKCLKENNDPLDKNTDDLEVYVKWEASKDNPGKIITTLKVLKDSTLADLRKLIEIHLGADQLAFTFLLLGDPSGAPVPKEEATTETSKLPVCNNQLRGHLASLRPVKTIQLVNHLPFSPLENKLATTSPDIHFTNKGDDCFSPKIAQHLSSTPYVTVRRY